MLFVVCFKVEGGEEVSVATLTIGGVARRTGAVEGGIVVEVPG